MRAAGPWLAATSDAPLSPATIDFPAVCAASEVAAIFAAPAVSEVAAIFAAAAAESSTSPVDVTTTCRDARCQPCCSDRLRHLRHCDVHCAFRSGAVAETSKAPRVVKGCVARGGLKGYAMAKRGTRRRGCRRARRRCDLIKIENKGGETGEKVARGLHISRRLPPDDGKFALARRS